MHFRALILTTGVAFAASAATEITPGDGPVYEDEAHALRFDGDGSFALDAVFFDDRNSRDSQLRLDRALLGGSASWGEIAQARVMFDAVGTDTRWGLAQAWASGRYERYARISGGLLPIAIGVEDSFSDESRSLAGYPSFASFLTGRTDFAVELDGELGDGLFSYDTWYAAGEGYDRFGQRRGDPAVGGRVMSYPLRFVDAAFDVGPYHFPLASGWFVSVGAAHLFDYDAHLDVATPLRNKLYDTDRFDGRGGQAWNFAFGVDFGPIRIVHETVKSGIDGLLLPNGTREDIEDDEITSWHALVSWRITGEPYDSRSFRQRDYRRPPPPRRPFDGEGEAEGWGALELAVRYANGDIDRDLQTFGLIARNPNAPPPENFTSSQEFRTFTVGLNWDPTSYLRISGIVVRVLADQYPAVFDSHGRDTSGLVRLQYVF
jgi:hypothetical protein